MQSSMGAIIVDPITRRVVAQAHTDIDHLTRHAVMVCIDQVARDQGGGALCNDSKGKESTLQQLADQHREKNMSTVGGKEFSYTNTLVPLPLV